MDNLDTKEATNSCLALKSPTLSEANIAPEKMVLGKLLSFWGRF